jgi:putative membrane-bound dehydrogenase-like protein
MSKRASRNPEIQATAGARRCGAAAAFTAVLALSFAAPAGPAIAGAAGWRAAAAKLDATPSRPLRLGGQRERLSLSEGVEDALQVRVLVLEDAVKVLTVLVSLESYGVSAWLRERVCGAIRGRTGIYRVRIAFAATGTRFAPALYGLDEPLPELDDAEREALREHSDLIAARIVEGIDACRSGLEPAELAWGAVPAPETRAALPGDPAAAPRPFLAVRRPDGRPVAVVFHAAAAGARLPGRFNRVCGEGPGHAAARLEGALAGAVALPLAGEEAALVERAVPVGLLHERAAGAFEAAAEAAISASLRGDGLEAAAGAIDARIEYLELPAGAGPRRAPIQAFLFGTRRAMLFIPGPVEASFGARLRKRLAPVEAWCVARANDHASLEGEGAEEALAAGLERLAASDDAGAAARIRPPAPLTPGAALESFRLAPGLRIDLAAAEPELADPVAFAFDEHGRLLVCEMRDYPLGPGEGKPPDGRVRLLEDRDRDGYFESSSIYADQVPFPTGIACWRGGVFVAATRDILYLKDLDGDGRAELREAALSGFDDGNSQHLLNSLTWGADGWIHVNGGDGAGIRCPRRPDRPELRLSHANFRFRPETLWVERETGYQGGYGIAFDGDGRRFACSSTNHGRQVLFEHHHLARNPALAGVEVFQTTSDHDQWVHPAGPQLERFNDPMDAGRFSSACGLHVYEGSALPAEYRGCIVVCEPVSNLVHCDRLESRGAAARARRSIEGGEFLASTDPWFRPVFAAAGPDGALYIADMYREVIEHPEWIPLHVQKLFDLRSGMDRGRIYRIARRDAPPRAGEPWRGFRAEGLVEELSGAEAWRVETALRLLQEEERRRDSLRRELEEAARLSAVDDGTAGRRQEDRCRRALSALERLGVLDAERLREALRAEAHPRLRAWALPIAERWLMAAKAAGKAGPESEALEVAVADCAGDPDPWVRFRAALALGAATPERRIGPLARIAALDAGDPWTEGAVLCALDERPLELLEALAGGEAPSPAAAAFAGRVGELIARRGVVEETAHALDRLLEDGDRFADAAARLVRALGPGGWPRLRRELERRAEADAAWRRRVEGIRAHLGALFAELSRRAGDESMPVSRRVEALSLLGQDGGAAALDRVSGFLDARYPHALRAAAARSLAGFTEARAAAHAAVLSRFGLETPRLRLEILDALLGAAGGPESVLGAIEDERMAPADVDLTRRRALVEHADVSVRDRAARAFAPVAVDADRAALIERYRGAIAGLSGAPDPGRGRELFRRHCGVCHRLGGEGEHVGPDLESVRQREREALLIDILDPNRSVSPEFANYVLITADGRVLDGLLASETPSSVVLRRAEGREDVVLRRDIRELRATRTSVMPEGLEQQLSPADLWAVIDLLKPPP